MPVGTGWLLVNLGGDIKQAFSGSLIDQNDNFAFGMHIGHKSETSPQWIWATFEQVDNLDIDQVAHPNLRPSFFDPDCPLCTVNVQPQVDPNTRLYPRTRKKRAL